MNRRRFGIATTWGSGKTATASSASALALRARSVADDAVKPLGAGVSSPTPILLTLTNRRRANGLTYIGTEGYSVVSRPLQRGVSTNRPRYSVESRGYSVESRPSSVESAPTEPATAWSHAATAWSRPSPAWSQRQQNPLQRGVSANRTRHSVESPPTPPDPHSVESPPTRPPRPQFFKSKFHLSLTVLTNCAAGPFPPSETRNSAPGNAREFLTLGALADHPGSGRYPFRR